MAAAARSRCNDCRLDIAEREFPAGTDIGPALEEAGRITDRPIFIDFLVDREANVWPMVPAGAGIDEMMNA